MKFENVSKIYHSSYESHKTVLRDILFSINEGDFVVILGESGCGKTTLLNMLAGFEMPNSGRILATGFKKARPEELSLGMAQRVCIARALVGHPATLIMDEPFASLDTFIRAHIQEELVNIWLSEQFTSVFVTHDLETGGFSENYMDT